MSDEESSPPTKKANLKEYGSSDAPTANLQNSKSSSSNQHTPKMFCCGQQHNLKSSTKRDPQIFEKASAALIELLLKIRNVDTDFTVLDLYKSVVVHL